MKNKKKGINLNRKGFGMIDISDKLMFWFIILFVITLSMVLIISWTTSLKNMYLDESLQPTAYEARLLYSDKCFAYRDDATGRVYTGTIDPQKFTQNTLLDCLPLDGMAKHAISVKLEAENLQPLIVDSANWKMKTEQIVVHTNVVEVEGYGPGLITFYHKLGE